MERRVASSARRAASRAAGSAGSVGGGRRSLLFAGCGFVRALGCFVDRCGGMGEARKDVSSSSKSASVWCCWESSVSESSSSSRSGILVLSWAIARMGGWL